MEVENKPWTLTLNKGLVLSRAVGCCPPLPLQGMIFSLGLRGKLGEGRVGCALRPGVDRLLKTTGEGQRMHCGMWEIVNELAGLQGQMSAWLVCVQANCGYSR